MFAKRAKQIAETLVGVCSDLIIVEIVAVDTTGAITTVNTRRPQDVYAGLDASWEEVPVVFGVVTEGLVGTFVYQGFDGRDPEKPFLVAIPAAASTDVRRPASLWWPDPRTDRQPHYEYQADIDENIRIGSPDFVSNIAFFHWTEESGLSSTEGSPLGLVGFILDRQKYVVMMWVNTSGELVIQARTTNFDAALPEQVLLWETKLTTTLRPGGYPDTVTGVEDPTTWLTNLTHVPEHNILLVVPPQANWGIAEDWRRELITLDAVTGAELHRQDLGWNPLEGFNVVNGRLVKTWARYDYLTSPGLSAIEADLEDNFGFRYPSASTADLKLIGYDYETASGWVKIWEKDFHNNLGAGANVSVNQDAIKGLFANFPQPPYTKQEGAQSYMMGDVTSILRIRGGGVVAQDETNSRVVFDVLEYGWNNSRFSRPVSPVTNLDQAGHWDPEQELSNFIRHVLVCFSTDDGSRLWRKILNEEEVETVSSRDVSMDAADIAAPGVIDTYNNADPTLPSGEEFLPDSTTYNGTPTHGQYPVPGGGIQARMDPDYSGGGSSWSAPRDVDLHSATFWRTESGLYNNANDSAQHLDSQDLTPFGGVVDEGYTSLANVTSFWPSLKNVGQNMELPVFTGGRTQTRYARPVLDQDGNAYAWSRPPNANARHDWNGSTATFSGFVSLKKWNGSKSTTLSTSPHIIQEVVDGYQSAPPGSPAVADRYVVKSPGSGAWAGKGNQFARWDGSVWVFETISDRRDVHAVFTKDRRFMGSYAKTPLWASFDGGGGAGVYFNPITGVWEEGRDQDDAIAEDPTDFDYVLVPSFGITSDKQPYELVSVDAAGVERWRWALSDEDDVPLRIIPTPTVILSVSSGITVTALDRITGAVKWTQTETPTFPRLNGYFIFRAGVSPNRRDVLLAFTEYIGGSAAVSNMDLVRYTINAKGNLTDRQVITDTGLTDSVPNRWFPLAIFDENPDLQNHWGLIYPIFFFPNGEWFFNSWVSDDP